MFEKAKRLLRRQAAAWAALALLLSCFAGAAAVTDSGSCGDSLTWTLDADGVLTISGTGDMENFDGTGPWGQEITQAVIESGVTSIGDCAFYDCTHLVSVSIPESVTSIGNDAFFFCESLTDAAIPAGVTSIGEAAFGYCKALPSVTIPAGVTTIAQEAFTDCYALTDLVIPAGVTTIEKNGFAYCYSLANLTISEGVTTIGDRAFLWCDQLNTVTIPASVTAIGELAFSYCEKLTGFSVDAGNPSYFAEDGVLFDKNTSVLIQYPMGKTDTSYEVPQGVTGIADYGFRNCNALTAVTFPESLTGIGKFAFYDCNGLTALTIPGSVTNIGVQAFDDCDALVDVTLQEGVASIGEKAFWYCSGLTALTIPASLTSIGKDAFSGCEKLASLSVSPDNPNYCDGDGALVDKNSGELILHLHGKTNPTYVVPEGVTSIGESAFQNDNNLINVIIPEGVTSIGDYGFCGCENLVSVTIPASVTSMGKNVFTSCWKLASISVAPGNPRYYDVDGALIDGDSGTLLQYPLGRADSSYAAPETVTAIGPSAFEDADNLISVTLPVGVTQIGDFAFFDCIKLTTVTIPVGVTTIPSGAFSYCASLTSVTIPEGVTTIDVDAFTTCTALTTVTLPATVTTIGDWAFEDCENLRDVYYGGSESDWTNIAFGEINESLTSANIHYRSSTATLPDAVSQTPYSVNFPEKATGAVYTVSADTLPAWMTAKTRDDGVLALSGTPTAPGQYTLQVYAVGSDTYLVGQDTYLVGQDTIYLGLTVKEKADSDSGGDGSGSSGGGSSSSETQFLPTLRTYQSGYFTDVPASAWYAPGVQFVYGKGLMNGVGGSLFAPDGTITRGMIAAILHRAEGSPAVNSLTAEGYFALGASWAAEKGILKGDADAALTREDLVVALCNYLKFKGVKLDTTATLDGFTDAEQVSAAALPSMAWAVSQGLVKGNGENALNPGGICTRAELAVLLQRTMTYLSSRV